jgi:hypothetical protein
MTMAPSDVYICTYSLGGQTEVPRECGNRAIKLVVWPEYIAKNTTMLYCPMHFNGVVSFLDEAVEVTDLIIDGH